MLTPAVFPQCFSIQRRKFLSSDILKQKIAVASILYNFDLCSRRCFSSTCRRKLLGPICSPYRFQVFICFNPFSNRRFYTAFSREGHFAVAPSIGASVPLESGSNASLRDKPDSSDVFAELQQHRLIHVSDIEAAIILKYIARNESSLATAVNSLTVKTRKQFMKCLFESVEKEQTAAWLSGSSTSVQHAADTIFDSLDLNKDGQVTQREFRTWYKLHMAPSFYSSSGDSITKTWFTKREHYAKESESNATGLSDFPVLTPNEISTAADNGSNFKGLSYEENFFDHEDPLTSWQICVVVFRSSIPYLGFGFMDNWLMIFCGDLIDHHLGVLLGISTLGAAGLGNLVSCATGVVTGGFIERVTYKLGLPSAHLSTAQADSKRVKNLHLVGSVLGICVGCFIGMFPLLLMPPRKRSSERQITNDAEE